MFSNFLDTPFQKSLLQLQNTLSFHAFLKNAQKKAYVHLEKMQLPTSKSEGYGFISLKKFYDQNFICVNKEQEQKKITKQDLNHLIYPECKESHLVFIDGVFCIELSSYSGLPTSVKVQNLSESARKFSTVFESNWAKSLKEESDPFVLLNAALFQEGAFVYVPPNIRVETPIQILHLKTQAKQMQIFFPRIHVFAGKKSHLSMIHSSFAFKESKIDSQEDSSYSSFVADLFLEEGSFVHWDSFHFSKKNEWLFHAVRAHLKKNACFDALCINNGSQTTKESYCIQLQENAQSSVKGTTFLDASRQAHIFVEMNHQAENSQSNQLFKNILKDRARTSFEGKIFIEAQAQHSHAFQLNNNLLLSDKAQSFTKPNLEILADDVKASHGATCGALDEEAFFYLQTRGIPKELAQNILLQGFCEQIVQEICLESTKTQVLTYLEQFLTTQPAKDFLD